MPVILSRRGVAASPIGSAALRRRAERMLEALRLPRAELSILICDDALIHQLNRDYRGKDRPTDVLAFAMREGEPVLGDGQVLGDVVISLDTSLRQAAALGRPVLEEATMLLAHGLLHLLGYDHQTDAEDRRMRARTDMLWLAGRGRRRVGRGPVRVTDGTR